MNTENAEREGNRGTTIEIAGTDLVFRQVALDTETPTGGKIAKAAGFNGGDHPFVLQWMDDGDFEGLRVQEEADLRKGTKFIVTAADSANRIAIDGNELDWPAETISGAMIRKLGRVPDDRLIYLERVEQPDRAVDEKDSIRIANGGIEEFKSRKPEVWKLNVQGKIIESMTPTITVIDALTRAGFDPDAWIIILKVEGQPKRQLAVGDTIDLRAPGVEKVRLIAKDVNNGEALPTTRRDFAMLEADECYLDGLTLHWETKAAGSHRWLIIRGYPVPAGYTITATDMALLVPPNYPQAEIDMFYVHPPLQKSAGGSIPATESTVTIDGLSFQRWSRHRGPGSRWNPLKDSLVTHLALVEAAIAKEVDP
ncbi:MAG: hypothetical protein E5X77_09420 [Mesorhizobium sp.]|nr:MAG: hypothetical protein E5X77_09420 [Mesorhizobium sp.]